MVFIPLLLENEPKEHVVTVNPHPDRAALGKIQNVILQDFEGQLSGGVFPLCQPFNPFFYRGLIYFFSGFISNQKFNIH